MSHWRTEYPPSHLYTHAFCNTHGLSLVINGSCEMDWRCSPVRMRSAWRQAHLGSTRLHCISATANPKAVNRLSWQEAHGILPNPTFWLGQLPLQGQFSLAGQLLHRPSGCFCWHLKVQGILEGHKCLDCISQLISQQSLLLRGQDCQGSLVCSGFEAENPSSLGPVNCVDGSLLGIYSCRGLPTLESVQIALAAIWPFRRADSACLNVESLH